MPPEVIFGENPTRLNICVYLYVYGCAFVNIFPYTYILFYILSANCVCYFYFDFGQRMVFDLLVYIKNMGFL